MCLATELMSSEQKLDKSTQAWRNTVLPYKQTLLQGSLSPSNDGGVGEALNINFQPFKGSRFE